MAHSDKMTTFARQMTCKFKKMKQRQLLSWILFVMVTLTVSARKTDNLPLYQTLDSLMANEGEMIAQKEARLKMMCEGLSDPTLTDEHLFKIYEKIYDEYLAYNFDSAYYYINKNVTRWKSSGNADFYAASATRLAHLLAVSGLFDPAQRVLSQIHPEQISEENKVRLYDQLGELNLYRSEMAQGTPYFQTYIDSVQYYRKILMQVAPKESFSYIANRGGYLCELGDVDAAIRMFESYLPSFQPGDRHYSIIASTLAYFYFRKQQPDMQEKYLLLSAISDVKGCIRENISFRELTIFLMERGDLERSFQYISRASADAKAYGSQLRTLQTARLSPTIIQAYNADRKAALHRTNMLLVVLSVVALALFGFMLFTFWLLRKRRIVMQRIRQMNEELSCHNQEIQALNGQMKEDNLIKEQYIGRFLQLCSDLVHRSEERNKLLNRMARDHKLEDLYAELKSTAAFNEGVRLFHQNFDTAFLNIYPNFIEEVNRLMTEEHRFEIPDDTNKLSTELRILALIRLGITDNQRIADILRSSITTIYTYRSKLKARAVSKDTFEDDICRIGTY